LIENYKTLLKKKYARLKRTSACQTQRLPKMRNTLQLIISVIGVCVPRAAELQRSSPGASLINAIKWKYSCTRWRRARCACMFMCGVSRQLIMQKFCAFPAISIFVQFPKGSQR